MVPLRSIVDPLGLGRRAAGLGARAGEAGTELTARAAVAVLERTTASPRAADAVDAALRSPLAERAAVVLVDGPVVDRVVDRLLADGVLERAVDRLVAGGVADRLVERVLAGPELERLAATVLDSPGAERLVAQVLDSRLLDATVARALASEELWLVVDEIARSPSVTEAISHQGAGFADQVVGEVGQRSRRADLWLERRARRALRRGPRPSSTTADDRERR